MGVYKEFVNSTVVNVLLYNNDKKGSHNKNKVF